MPRLHSEPSKLQVRHDFPFHNQHPLSQHQSQTADCDLADLAVVLQTSTTPDAETDNNSIYGCATRGDAVLHERRPRFSPKYCPGRIISLENPFRSSGALGLHITQVHPGRAGGGHTRSCVVTGRLVGTSVPEQYRDRNFVAKFFDRTGAAQVRKDWSCEDADSVTEAAFLDALRQQQLVPFLEKCNESVDFDRIRDPRIREFFFDDDDDDPTEEEEPPLLLVEDLIRCTLRMSREEQATIQEESMPVIDMALRELFLWREMRLDFLHELSMFRSLASARFDFLPAFVAATHTASALEGNDDDDDDFCLQHFLKTPVIIMEDIDGVAASRFDSLIRERQHGKDVVNQGPHVHVPQSAEEVHSIFRQLLYMINILRDHGVEYQDFILDNVMARRNPHAELEMKLVDVGSIHAFLPAKWRATEKREDPRAWHWPQVLTQSTGGEHSPEVNLEEKLQRAFFRLARCFTEKMTHLSPYLFRIEDDSDDTNAALRHLILEDLRNGSRRAGLSEASITAVTEYGMRVVRACRTTLRYDRWGVAVVEILTLTLDSTTQANGIRSEAVPECASRLLQGMRYMGMEGGSVLDHIRAVAESFHRPVKPLQAGEHPRWKSDTDSSSSSEAGETYSVDAHLEMAASRPLPCAYLAATTYVNEHSIIQQHCWTSVFESHLPRGVLNYLSDTCQGLARSGKFWAPESAAILAVVMDDRDTWPI